MEKLQIKSKNGLGDKLLDILGAYVICKYLKYQLVVDFNGDNSNWKWGNNYYDENLLIFKDIEIVNNVKKENYQFIDIVNPSTTLAPYNVWKYLSIKIKNLEFREVCDKYKELANIFVEPSEVIKNYYNKNLENAYGIHLRHTDKIFDGDLTEIDDCHMLNLNEFKFFESKLLEDIEKIIIKDSEPIFFISSEDCNYKKIFQENVEKIYKKYNKNINIIQNDFVESEFKNFNSVLDMFSLSKCKEIYQNINYSTFSIFSGLFGSKNLVNYSKYKKNYTKCLIHNWNCIVLINNSYMYDFRYLEKCNKIWNGLINKENHKSFFIVAKFPFNFSWDYSNKLTDNDVCAFLIKNDIILSYDEKVALKIVDNNIFFTDNIFEASKVTLELDLITTHNRIKIGNKYIRHKYGMLFCEIDDGTELFKSDSIWNFIPNDIDIDHTFVVARYKEDVNWTRYLPGKVIIYNKGGDNFYINNLRNNISTISLPNLGREGHTYLHHIIENYDCLTKRVTFLQGNPFEHSPDLLELCCMSKDFDDVQSLSSWYKNDKEDIPSKNIINLNLKYLNGARFAQYPINIIGDFVQWKDPFWEYGINKYSYNKDPIRYFLEKCDMKEKINSNFYMSIAALFSCKKENIQTNSLENYKNIMKELLSSDQQGGFEVYILERIWYPLMK
jgi:hypothetical protein